MFEKIRRTLLFCLYMVAKSIPNLFMSLGNDDQKDWVILSPDNSKTWKVMNGGTDAHTGDSKQYICQYDGELYLVLIKQLYR